MRTLVAVASKHGATLGIAGEISRVLGASGVDAKLSRIGESVELDEYDAVVLGSAVYRGHWMPEALKFVAEHVDSLAARPVWLFSSGPVGDPPKGSVDEQQLERIATDTGARGHRIFGGSIDPDDLDMKERVLTKVVRVPSGDFRDWSEIRTWAEEIARSLQAEAAGSENPV